MSADQVWSIDWSHDSRTDPLACEPWCEDRHEGHWPAGVTPECSSALREMTLSTGDWVGDGEVAVGLEAEMVPDYAGVYLWKASDGIVTVNISHHEQIGMPLTAVEARELAGTLLSLAALADTSES